MVVININALKFWIIKRLNNFVIADYLNFFINKDKSDDVSKLVGKYSSQEIWNQWSLKRQARRIASISEHYNKICGFSISECLFIPQNDKYIISKQPSSTMAVTSSTKFRQSYTKLRTITVFPKYLSTSIPALLFCKAVTINFWHIN